MANDMKQAIVPKSDQTNADDLLSGPITITISNVAIRGGQEQPVSIGYEGDNGKPYKPCKSMCRVMVSAWGADSKKYIGRSMKLYRDAKVKWAGMEVGGIRISHMSDIADDMTMALTVTRANKKPFTVRPIKESRPKESAASPPPNTKPETVTDTGADGAADLITADQAIDIGDKLAEAGIAKERLLKATGVDSIGMLPASKYARALEWIEKARTK